MAVVLRDVSKRFGRHWALARVSLEIPTGQTALLTGENGAGKTTFLRVLATVLAPTSGEVLLFGKSSVEHRDELRQQTMLLTHQNHLYEVFSARENVRLFAQLRGFEAGAELEQQIDASLSKAGLALHADRAVSGFSAGMRRRVGIAKLILQQPRLVYLDEPFSQLDPEGVLLMETIIRDLQHAGTTMVIATHDIERGRALAHGHLVLQAGRLTRVL